MKKLLILSVCAAILFWWVYLTNAANVIKKSDAVTTSNNLNRYWELVSTDVINWGNVDETFMTWAINHNSATYDECDFNNDKEVNIADINRFNSHCSVLNWRDSNKCDLNKDWEFGVADVNLFNYTCYNKILWTWTNVVGPEEKWKICDFDSDWEINIADITRFIWECMNWNWKSEKCDLNWNGKYDVEDIVTFNNVCYIEVLWTWTNVVEPEEEWEMCDFDNDWKTDISDVTRFIWECMNWNWKSEKCDLNWNWKYDLEDMITFDEVCFNWLLWTWTNVVEPEEEWEMCDFNNDWEINIADKIRYNSNCSVVNWGYSNKCDLNKDWELNVADINVFNDTCYKKIIWWNTENWSDFSGKNRTTFVKNQRTNEFIEAYEFARTYWITTNEADKANMYSPLTRIQMAKMLSNYAINVLWMEPDASKWTINFIDVTEKQNSNYGNAVTLAYQLWIMWQNMKNNKFRPNDKVTRAEFATALSRMLYGIDDGNDKYYTTHIKKLKENWIISNDDPNLFEYRGYVMTMLMRAAE